MTENECKITWISDSNPKDPGLYLVSANGTVGLSHYSVAAGNRWDISSFTSGNIEAWSYLPTPYVPDVKKGYEIECNDVKFWVTSISQNYINGVDSSGAVCSCPRTGWKLTGRYNEALVNALSCDSTSEQDQKEAQTLSRDTTIKRILESKDEPSAGLNRMGCSENWYDSDYAISHTFEEGDIKNMTKHELDLLIKLADKMSEAFY